ncbi:MAG: GNAT family N-acetyltransferase [Candidatus Heimdallarchaeaceae archaeon]
MSLNNNFDDEIKIGLIDYDDVPAHHFPFFSSYRMYFDESIRCYGFYLKEELVAVTAILPDDEAGVAGGFVSVGCPIIYVFEVREDLRRKGIGYKCAQLLINHVLKEDTIQLCCSPFIKPFWEKVGFSLVYFDQSLFMNKMVLKKEC